MKQKRPLFSKVDMADQLRQMPDAIWREVSAWTKERLLGVPIEDLVSYFVERYAFDVPSLRASEMYVADSGDGLAYEVRYRDGRATPVRGPYITFAVPFSGDPDLFDWRAPTYYPRNPEAVVGSHEVQLTVAGEVDSVETLKERIGAQITAIEDNLRWLRTCAHGWAEQCPEVARNLIQQRKTTLLNQERLVAALGVPVAMQPGAPQALAVPVQRKSRPVSAPPAPASAFTPEPIVSDADFAGILETIESMSRVWERSPSAFKSMGEEDLRTTLLFALNGQYASATAETFNKGGKTDILIREGGRNVFIAECKIWAGPKALGAAIDQILSYLTWRDSKAALLVFNRNKSFSEVLEALGKAVPAHPNFKRAGKMVSETHAQYVFRQNDDAARETILAVLAFDVPK